MEFNHSCADAVVRTWLKGDGRDFAGVIPFGYILEVVDIAARNWGVQVKDGLSSDLFFKPNFIIERRLYDGEMDAESVFKAISSLGFPVVDKLEEAYCLSKGSDDEEMDFEDDFELQELITESIVTMCLDNEESILAKHSRMDRFFLNESPSSSPVTESPSSSPVTESPSSPPVTEFTAADYWTKTIGKRPPYTWTIPNYGYRTLPFLLRRIRALHPTRTNPFSFVFGTQAYSTHSDIAALADLFYFEMGLRVDTDKLQHMLFAYGLAAAIEIIGGNRLVVDVFESRRRGPVRKIKFRD